VGIANPGIELEARFTDFRLGKSGLIA